MWPCETKSLLSLRSSIYTDFSNIFSRTKENSKWDIMCLNLNIVYSHDKVTLFFISLFTFKYLFSFHCTHPVQGVFNFQHRRSVVARRLQWVATVCLHRKVPEQGNPSILLHLPRSLKTALVNSHMKSFLNIILMPNLILGVAFVILHTDQTYCHPQEQKLHLLVSRRLNSPLGKKLSHTKPVKTI